MVRNPFRINSRSGYGSSYLFLTVAFAVFFATVFSSIAQSNWRDDIGTFRVGILAGNDSAGAIRRAELFREAMNTHLDVPVELIPFGDLSTLIQAQVSGRVEYAIHSALSFTVASASCECLVPLAVPTFSGGAKGTHAVIFALSDGPRTLSDLENQTIGILVKEDFVTGTFAEIELKQSGFDLRTAGVAVLKLNSDGDALEALQKGTVKAVLDWSTLSGDAGQGFSHGLFARIMASEAAPDVGTLRLIWQSDMLPNGPHAVRRNLASEAKKKVQDFLLSLETKNPAAYDVFNPRLGGGFLPVQLSEYKAVRDLLSDLQEDQQTEVLNPQ